MKLTLFLHPKADHRWTLARQIGVKRVIAKLSPERTGRNAPWDRAALAAAVRDYEAAGFTVAGLEGDQFDMSRIKRGLPGRDEDLEKYQQMLRNMGELGIPLLCYNFMVHIGWFRTRMEIPERGGALTSGFYAEDIKDSGHTEIGTFEEDEVWHNYRTFIDAVLPVAEEAGVRMGLHPDDPPVSPLRGIARIFISADAFRKAMSFSESESHAITFCQANFKAMGEDLFELAREFGGANRIAYIHWRDIEGTKDAFHETFHDNGPTDMPAILKYYHELGLDVPIRPDHVPTLEGEDPSTGGYEMLGRLFAIGYLKGILDTAGIPVS